MMSSGHPSSETIPVAKAGLFSRRNENCRLISMRLQEPSLSKTAQSDHWQQCPWAVRSSLVPWCAYGSAVLSREERSDEADTDALPVIDTV